MQVSILMVRALAAEVERAGASREQFLQAAGIDERSLDDGSVRLSLVDYMRAIDAALEVSGNPALGLHVVEHARPFMFDVIGPLVEQAASLRAGIESIVRYSQIVAEGHEPVLIEEADAAVIRFPSVRGDLPAARVTAELAMSGLASMLRTFVGEHARSMEVAFAHDEPAHVAEYERIFGKSVCFGRPFTQMTVPRAWLDKSQKYTSPELYALLETQAERSLGRLQRDAALSARIERILNEHGPQSITMQTVARELGISARSLRRRMQTEGVRFSELVTRHQVRSAKRMLERPGASMKETAYALGFASAAAFHRAFKRWTGMTPKQYQDSF